MACSATHRNGGWSYFIENRQGGFELVLGKRELGERALEAQALSSQYLIWVLPSVLKTWNDPYNFTQELTVTFGLYNMDLHTLQLSALPHMPA